MLVKELIAMLQELPQQLEVMVDGYEGGVDEPSDPYVVGIDRFHNGKGEGCPYYYGQHEINRANPDLVVYLSR